MIKVMLGVVFDYTREEDQIYWQHVIEKNPMIIDQFVITENFTEMPFIPNYGDIVHFYLDVSNDDQDDPIFVLTSFRVDQIEWNFNEDGIFDYVDIMGEYDE
jgi:hypothetical protein